MATRRSKMALALAVILTLMIVMEKMPTASCQTATDPPITYRCQQDSPTIVVSKRTVRLELRHPNPQYLYLKPNQHCRIRVQTPSHDSPGGAVDFSRVKWLVSVDSASLRAYSASAVITDGSGGWALLANLTARTERLGSFQVATVSNNFSVELATRVLPEELSTGLVLLAEPFVRCPSGWLDSGIGCYGTPHRLEAASALTQPQSRAACRRMGASLSNGVYSNDHIGQTLASLLNPLVGAANSSDGRMFWVGIVRQGQSGSFSYINGYSSPHTVEVPDDCATNVSSCSCVAYKASTGSFFAQRCTSRHAFVCAMEPADSACWMARPLPVAMNDRRAKSADGGGGSCSGGCSGWYVFTAFLIVVVMLVGGPLLIVRCSCCVNSSPVRVNSA